MPIFLIVLFFHIFRPLHIPRTWLLLLLFIRQINLLIYIATHVHIMFYTIFQEKFEWIEEPVDKTIKQGIDEVSFSAKLSHKGKKAKWYLRNNVSILKNSCETFFFYSGQMPFFQNIPLIFTLLYNIRQFVQCIQKSGCELGSGIFK